MHKLTQTSFSLSLLFFLATTTLIVLEKIGMMTYGPIFTVSTVACFGLFSILFVLSMIALFEKKPNLPKNEQGSTLKSSAFNHESTLIKNEPTSHVHHKPCAFTQSSMEIVHTIIKASFLQKDKRSDRQQVKINRANMRTKQYIDKISNKYSNIKPWQALTCQAIGREQWKEISFIANLNDEIEKKEGQLNLNGRKAKRVIEQYKKIMKSNDQIGLRPYLSQDILPWNTPNEKTIIIQAMQDAAHSYTNDCMEKAIELNNKQSVLAHIWERVKNPEHIEAYNDL